MARISTYPIISTPTLNDLLIGTDVQDLNITKNFTIDDIASLIIGGSYVPYVGATGNVNLGAFSIEATSFVVPGGTASDFLKADGSLDSTVYQPAGNYITQLSGEATASGPGNATVTLSNAAVIGKILTGLTITGNAIVSTDSILTAFGKVQNQINTLVGGVQYKGTWNAATNTPTLQSSVGVQGNYYVVSVAGNTDLNGITDWNLGDWAIFNGSSWEKVDNTDAVISVNGQVGAVVLTTTNIAEGTNLYYTDTRVRTAISLTTIGNNGASTYSNITGVFNIPEYTLAGLGGVPLTRQLTINGTAFDLSADRSWSVGTVTSIATTGPLTGGTITGSGTIGITQASASSDGYLSSTDWTTFNNKQNAITNPVTGTGTPNTLPMWGTTSSLINSPLSYAADTFNFQYNSATGGTVNFTNIGLTTYTYSIQMNNFGSPRSTIHSYTDGLVIQSIGGTQVSRIFANGNMILGAGTVDNSYKLEITGDLYVSSIVNATTDTDRFLVSDGGLIKYRTGAEVLNDIGAQGTLTLTTTGTSGPATLISNTLNIPNYGSVLTGYVPYTGATQNVNLGEFGLTTGFLGFDLTPTSTPSTPGTMFWSADDETVDIIMDAAVTQKVGQETFYLVKNQTGTSIPKGTVVRADGTVGASGRILIAPFLANGTFPSKFCIGVTTETIADGADGFVTAFGKIRQINTASYTEGTILYASPTSAGGFTTTAPQAPNNIVTVAIVITSSTSNGAIFVRTTFGANINEDEGVKITSPVLNEGLFYNGGYWINKTIASALGYTPANQATTLTINGQTYDLSANRTWSVGTVTSVDLSVPTGFAIAGNPVTTAGTLALTFASGYSLPTNASQANWDTAYTNRITSLTTTGTSGAATLISNVLNIPQYQAQGNYITSLTGEATASGPGAASVTLSNSAVTGKVLTGLTVAGSSIASTDSILTAFGKLQGQVNDLIGGLQYQGTWNASTNTPTITSGVGTDGHFYIVSVAGNTTIDGVSGWQVGDWIVFHSPAWQKVDNTESVVSVNGFTGAVTLTTSNISEGTNLYFTNARARTAISLTTTGNSGAATYTSGTGVLNVPQYTLAGLGGVPTTRSITINGTAFDLSADRTYNVGTVTSIATTGPITGGTITGSGTIGITQASSSTNGYLSSVDWNTFNNKQATISLTTTGSSGASTFISNVLNVPNYTLSGLGGVPTSRTITINGIGFDLSADRSYSVGTVTSVGLSSATSGVTIGSTPVTTSGTITLAIATASGSQNGLLSSTDWTTFNGKQNALTNPVTGTGTTNTIPKFTGSTTIGNSQIIDNGTNVGIGVSPSSKLFINTGGVGATSNGIGMDNGAQQHFWYLSDNTTSTYQINSSSGVFRWVNSNGELIRIFSNGNVFIGPSPSDNGAKLQVSGTATFSSSVTINNASIYNRVFSDILPANDAQGVIYVREGNLSGADGLRYASRTHLFQSHTGSNYLAITSGGNVGIGTTSPNNIFTIYAASSAIYTQWIQSGTGTTSTDGLRIGLDASSNGIIDLNEGTALITKVDGSEGMRIFAGRNVHIGPTPAADNGARLQVSGTGRFDVNSQNIILTLNNPDNTKSPALTFAIGGSTRSIIQVNNSNSNFNFLVNSGDTTALSLNGSTGAATFSSALTSSDLTIKNSANSETLDLFLSPSTLNGFIDYPSGRSLTIRNKGSLGNLTLASTGAATFSSSVTAGSTINTSDGFYSSRTGSDSIADGAYIQLASNGFIQANAANGLDFWTLTLGSWTKRLRLTNGGNVLIGTTTDNGARLQVSGAANITGDLRIGTALTYGYIYGPSNQIFGSIGVNTTWINAGTSGLRFNNAADNLTLMFMSNSGNVGIGTASPDLALTVNGAINMRNSIRAGAFEITSGGDLWMGTATTAGNIYLETGHSTTGLPSTGTPRMTITGGGNVLIGTTTDTGSRLGIKSSGTNSYPLIVQRSANTNTLAAIYETSGGDGSFLLANSLGSTNIQLLSNGTSILNGGNVLIGTATDTGYTLNVVGNAQFIKSSTSTAMVVGLSGVTGSIIRFSYNGGFVGSISTDGSNTAYNTSSDYRLKQDIKDFNGLDLLSRIKTYDFEWKSDKTRSYGVLAHELQEVINYAVTGSKDAEEMQGVDYSKIVPILIKAIQELNEKIK